MKLKFIARNSYTPLIALVKDIVLTNAQGGVVAGYAYDLNNGAIKSKYSTHRIDNSYKYCVKKL